MRIAYEEGSMSDLEMLFEANSFIDFLISAERIAAILDYEKDNGRA